MSKWIQRISLGGDNLYSSEIEQFLKERNYKIDRMDCIKIINPDESIQIKDIKYYAADSQYVITTDDGYCFRFNVI